MNPEFKFASEVADALEISAPGTTILLAKEKGATIEAAANKFKHGFAIIVKGKGGKYNVAGNRQLSNRAL